MTDETDTPDLSLFIVPGERVEISKSNKNLRGTAQYVGPVKELGNGIFVGIELDEFIDDGHDGSIDGKSYFNCNNGHGQFVIIEQCTKYTNGYITNHQHINGKNIHLENNNNNNLDINNNDIIIDEEIDNDKLDNNDDIDEEDHHKPNKNNNNNNKNKLQNGLINHNDINSSELELDEIQRNLDRKFKRRKSQLEIEQQGVVPPNYFNDPITTTQNMHFGHEMVSSNLEEWLPQRSTKHDLESRNIVPHNYFEDPIASTKGKSLVKEMISSNLEEFHEKRPTLDQLQMKNIIPPDFAQSMQSSDMDHIDAYNQQMERQKSIHNQLNEKLGNGRRPTITDLGDMHIIPHDYLDNLLEDAVANHRRKQSRMDHVQDRLQKHLPEPVAQTLAETLVDSVQNDDDQTQSIHSNINQQQQSQHDHTDIHNNIANHHQFHNGHTHHHQDNSNEDDEWQISFVYEPMQNFVPMNPAQKDEVTNKLERRLSLRPSKQQIEVWGFVPPQYFESPVKILYTFILFTFTYLHAKSQSIPTALLYIVFIGTKFLKTSIRKRDCIGFIGRIFSK